MVQRRGERMQMADQEDYIIRFRPENRQMFC